MLVGRDASSRDQQVIKSNRVRKIALCTGGLDTTCDEHAGLLDHRGIYLLQSVLAISNAPFAFGIVKSSNAGEKGIGTFIAPIRLTGASR